MTKAEFIDLIAARLFKKILNESTWIDFINLINSLSTVQQAALLEAIKNRDEKLIGHYIFGLASDAIKSKANLEATTLMADDTLTTIELLRIFGN